MNILDMEPDAFEGALKELGLEPEREQFLRDEYAKKNTVSGQMLGAFQEATAPAEGMERASVLPMVKPEGMSGIEAISSGKAELALPGFLTAMAESIPQTLTTGEKIVKGIDTTEEENTGAAMTLSSLGMANIPKALTREFDPTFIPIFGGPNAKKFPKARAEGAKLSKGSPQTTWEDTGIEYIVDETGVRPIFQIDPKGAKIAKPVDVDPDLKAKLRRGRYAVADIPLKDLMDFPELYDNYPVLQDFNVKFDSSLADGGFFDATNKAIVVNIRTIDNPKKLRELLLHELQHGVQAVEGTPGGSNVDNFILKYDPKTAQFKTGLTDPNFQSDVDALNFAARKAANKGLDTPEYKGYADTYTNVYREAYKKYSLDSGEIEARAAALWDELSPQEKLTTKPSDVYREALGLLKREFNSNLMPVARLQNYAEGGMVEDEEMNRLMAEGGITDDGMNIEPVTGNEVPPGSLASEVRDDIPAKLSEGEYVVPADVVRYFGVRFFEDLRSQAKQGLAQMDADGRIGGATVNANGVPMEEEEEGEEEELTPEEEQMLMEALGSGMYKGGVVGMAEGGFTQRDPAFGARSFDRTSFSLPQTGGIEIRTYYNPSTKEKKSIQFVGGNPISAIPVGFVPYTEGMENQAPTTPVATTVAPTTTSTPSQSNSGGSGAPAATSTTGQGQGEGFNYDKWAEKNKEAITANPYQFGLDALADTTGKMLSTGLGVAGIAMGNPVPLIGAGVSKGYNAGQNIAEARAALQVMEAQGKLDSPEYKSLERQINKAISDLPGVVQLAVKNDFAATGNNYFKALTKAPATTRREEPAKAPVKEPVKEPVTTSLGVASTPLPTSRSSSESGASSTFKATTQQAQKSKDISAGKTAAAGKSYTSKGGYTSGRAKGGLVEKPKRKSLASK